MVIINNPRQLLVSFFGLETHKVPVAKFIVPDRRDKVDSGIALSYRPARLYWLAGRYDNPMPETTLSPPPRDYEFGYWYLYTVNWWETIGFEQLHELKVLSSEEALWYFEGLSEDGGRWIFLKTFRASHFNEDLSNEPNFGRIHLAGQYL